MSIPDNRRPPNNAQGPLPGQYGIPSYGAPQQQPNYGQPAYGQPAYDQFGQPIYPQQPYPQQPQYGQAQPQYGQQTYGQPQYGQPMPQQPAYGYPAAQQPAVDQFGQPIYPQQAYAQPEQPVVVTNDIAWSGPVGGTQQSMTLKVRKKSYLEAQGILAFIGIATLLLNTFLFFNREKELDDAINQEIRAQQAQAATRGMQFVVEPRALAELRGQALKIVTVIYGGFIGLGLFFLLLALMVPSYPVGATATGLTLYVGTILAFALFDENFLKNPFLNPIALLIKALITAALVRAIMAAHAYRRELNRLTLSAAR